MERDLGQPLATRFARGMTTLALTGSLLAGCAQEPTPLHQLGKAEYAGTWVHESARPDGTSHHMILIISADGTGTYRRCDVDGVLKSEMTADQFNITALDDFDIKAEVNLYGFGIELEFLVNEPPSTSRGQRYLSVDGLRLAALDPGAEVEMAWPCNDD